MCHKGVILFSHLEGLLTAPLETVHHIFSPYIFFYLSGVWSREVLCLGRGDYVFPFSISFGDTQNVGFVFPKTRVIFLTHTRCVVYSCARECG